MNAKLVKWLPWAVGAIAVLAVLAGTRGASAVRGFDVTGFGHLPVLEGGRVKPVDSIARNVLLMIRSQQSFRFDPDGDAGPEKARTVDADEWLLDVLFRPELADKQPIFVINDPDVLGLMKIPQSTNRYYSFEQILPHVDEIQSQALAAQPKDPKERSRFESAVVNLFERVYLYHRLKNTVQLAGGGGLAVELAMRGTTEGFQRTQALTQLAYFRPLLPPPGSEDGWRSTGEALGAAGGAPNPALEHWARLGVAWTAQDPASFNTALATLERDAQTLRPDLTGQANHEWLFNQAQPFYAGMVIYVLAMLVLFASWLWKPELLRPIAFGLLVAGAIVHTGGLVSRTILQGRPPVTNLYSSAVFVGWVAVIVAVVLERMYRRGFGVLVGAASGFATLIIAHHLAQDGDTMEMMRAVLDSNFWLATHVTTITIGYAGTYFAGILAIAWIVWRLFGGTDAGVSKTLYAMTYGVVCFAVFFSFVGTVLGGIWADQSWGRFWGWDPKENGALLIVLWNAIILHARWGGYARERGVMAMAVVGNIITSLSWFGVNMLGVGLHSYGFMDKAFWALAAFSASQVLIIGLAYLPPRFWAKGGAPAAGERAQNPA
ncbi:MAG: cytochrome c biogenesis protein CcsA [Anaeromyxobacter sp.]